MPARKPRHEKLLNGTLRKDRDVKRPAIPKEGRAKAPAWLSVGERAAFNILAEQVEGCGMASGSFAHVLAATAVVWDQLRRDTVTIGEQGSTYETTTTTGARKLLLRPEVLNRAATLKLLRGYLGELGLTPLAIGRVDLTRMRVDDAHDATARMLFGPRGE